MDSLFHARKVMVVKHKSLSEEFRTEVLPVTVDARVSVLLLYIRFIVSTSFDLALPVFRHVKCLPMGHFHWTGNHAPVDRES